MVLFSQFLRNLDSRFKIKTIDDIKYVHCLSVLHKKHLEINKKNKELFDKENSSFQKRILKKEPIKPRNVDVFGYIKVTNEFFVNLCPSEYREWKERFPPNSDIINPKTKYLNIKISQKPLEMISISGFVKLISKIDRDELIEFSRFFSGEDLYPQKRKTKIIKKRRKRFKT